MATLTVELPDRLAERLATQAEAQRQLESFLVGAIEVWLRRRRRDVETDPSSWDGAFESSAVEFVDQLIDDNRELFEELARR